MQFVRVFMEVKYNIIGTKEKGKQWQNKKEANGRLLQESF